jgi:hypothetical protein
MTASGRSPSRARLDPWLESVRDSVARILANGQGCASRLVPDTGFLQYLVLFMGFLLDQI